MKAKRYIADEYQQKGADMKTKYIKVSMAIMMLLCFFTIYHLDAQNLLWKANFTGSGNNSAFKSAIDSKDNIYVVGTFNDKCNSLTPNLTSRGLNDVYIAKYDSNGVLLWINQIGSSLDDFGSGIVVSSDDEYIYVTGTYKATAYAGNDSIITNTGGLDGFLAKYNKDGGLLRFKRIAYGTGATTQRPNDIKIDKDKNLVIGGYFINNITLQGFDTTKISFTTTRAIGMFVAKFDTNGKIIKAKEFESNNGNSLLYTFDVDTSGYYLCGSFSDTLIIDDLGKKVSRTSNLYDMYVYKVDYNLVGQWFIKIAGNNSDLLTSCSVDNLGYLYIGGQFNSNTMTVDSNKNAIPSARLAYKNPSDISNNDVFFAKYSSEGVLQWFNTVGSKGEDKLYRALYKNGDFIVAGQYSDTVRFSNQMITSRNTANSDAFAIVQDENNNLVYLIPISGASGNEVGETSVVDNKGNFVVIGDYTSSRIYFSNKDSLDNSNAGTKDMFVAKYDKASISINKTDITCFGYDNGIAIANPYGTLVYPLTFQWTKKNNPAFTAATQTITSVSPGTYYVQVTDALNYVLHDSVVFNNPVLLAVTTDSSKNVHCFGGSDGKIYVTATGGALPYHYLWNSVNGSGLHTTDEDQSTLSAGTYYATVTDNKGCTAAISGITLDQPNQITTSAVVTPTTSGFSLGAIDLSVFGGTPGFTYLWSNASTTQDISSLGEGNYNVTVTDTNFCVKTASYYVPIGDSVAISFIATNVSCHGGSNGSIDLTVTGGIIPYTYAWSKNGGPTFATSEDIIGLDSARYTVTVTDRNGAGLPRTIDVNLIHPPALTSSIVKTDIGCYGQNTGILDLRVTGGVLPTSYSWVGPSGYTSNMEVITGLALGLYSVTITDNNGCTNTNGANITEPSALSVSAVASMVSCHGGQNNGSIALDVSGGIGPYTYAWSNGPTTSSISLLAQGDYTCTVNDINSCTQIVSQHISEPSSITASFSNNNIMCFGGTNGSATVNPSGGNEGFTYKWNNGSTTQTISSLAPGNYLVTVTDVKNCKGSFNTTITQLPVNGLSISQPITQDVNCIGNPNGMITVSGAGNMSPYQYLLKLNGNVTANNSGASTGIFTGVTPSNGYTIEVTDAYHCDTVVSGLINIAQLPSIITLSNPTVNNVTCKGLNNGTISVSASGGTAPYQYVLNLNGTSSSNTSGALSGSFTGLTPSNGYVVQVNDANNCGPVSGNTSSVSEPAAITITGESTQDATTKYPGNGVASITVSGGTLPYSFVLKLNGAAFNNSSGALTGTFTGLDPAIGYTIVVTDTNNCGPLSSDYLSVADATAIRQITESMMKIYPNPAREKLTIEFSNQIIDNVLIEIISMSGQVVFAVKVNKDMLRDGRYTFDLASQPRGLYLLKINDQIVKEKIILQ